MNKYLAAWRPAGEGEWFQVHVNALAVAFGLAPQERFAGIMEKAVTDETLIPVQPYFMHYVFDALDRAGLFEKYGNSQLRRWKVMLDECEWSLKEIWTDGGFPCDHSHAWGGTPVYQLGARVLGVKPVSQQTFRGQDERHRSLRGRLLRYVGGDLHLRNGTLHEILIINELKL